jgi:DNA invertase Pin-like site-specific DNA recombinase
VKSPQRPPNDETFLVGYARVSTEDQNLDMQVQALTAYGVDPRFIFQEKVSAVSRRRPELAKLWKELRPGDTLVVWKLDRLGRDIRDLLNRIHELGERNVRFISLRDHLDTETAVGRLMLAICAAMAQFERDLTSERTKAGIAARKARGLPHGMAPKFDRQKMFALLDKGLSGPEVAKRFGVTKSAIYQAVPPEQRPRYFREWRRRPKGKSLDAVMSKALRRSVRVVHKAKSK